MDSEDRRDEPEPTYEDCLAEQERLEHLWQEELQETLERLEPLGVLEGLGADQKLTLAAVFWDAEWDYGSQRSDAHHREERRKALASVSRKLKTADLCLRKARAALSNVLAAIDTDVETKRRWRLRDLRAQCTKVRDSIDGPLFPGRATTDRTSKQVLYKARAALKATFKGFKCSRDVSHVRTATIANRYLGDSVAIDESRKIVPAYRMDERRQKSRPME